MQFHIKHTSPSIEMAKVVKSLTFDEYIKLDELLRKNKSIIESSNPDNNLSFDIQEEIELFISKFPQNSRIVLHFNNWKKDSIQSDAYMSFIAELQRLSKSFCTGCFKNLL